MRPNGSSSPPKSSPKPTNNSKKPGTFSKHQGAKALPQKHPRLPRQSIGVILLLLLEKLLNNTTEKPIIGVLNATEDVDNGLLVILPTNILATIHPNTKPTSHLRRRVSS